MKFISILLFTTFCISLRAQQLLTVREVFDFKINDEFHFVSSIPNRPPNAERWLILNKYYSANSDTLFYRIQNDSYSTNVNSGTSPPTLSYQFSVDTIKLSYTNLDSSLYVYDSGFQQDTIFDTSCDSLVNAYYYCMGSSCRERHYAKGLGLVYNYYQQGGGPQGPAVMISDRLIFHKSGNDSCGTPDRTSIDLGEQIGSGNFTIYPNPAGDMIYIQGPNLPGNIELLTLSGKFVKTLQREENGLIHLSNVKTGLYIARFSNDDKVYNYRIIKK